MSGPNSETTPELAGDAGQESNTESSSTPAGSTSPQHNIDEAVDFLRTLRPSGPWCLWAKAPDAKQQECRVFRPDDVAVLRSWLAEVNGARHWNVYYHVNPARTEEPRRAKKSDVARVEFLHVDIDPRVGEDLAEEQARIRARLTTRLPGGVPEPSVVVFSGGGYQALWRLAEPILLGPDESTEADKLAAAAEAERYNRGLELAFADADSTHNIDRVLRLPGSVNWPSEKKREKGRVPTLARVSDSWRECAFASDDFPRAEPVRSVATKPVTAEPVAIAALDELPEGVSDLARVAIIHGADPEDPDRWTSRSEALHFVCCELVRASCDDATILGVILDSQWRISESVLAAKNADRYARRQVERARQSVAKSLDGAGIIVVAPGRLNEVVAEAQAALQGSSIELYQRGTELIRPLRLDRRSESSGVRREAGSVVLRPVRPHWLTQQMAATADWRMLDKKKKVLVPVDPKLDHARHVLDNSGDWPFPELLGVVHAPTLRSDGTVLQVSGYDELSGLILEPLGVDFPPIPDAPTHEEAAEALAKLEPLFAAFPFVGDGEPLRTPAYSVVLSAVLCGLVRRSMRTAPLHAFDAPAAGTGKSMIAETVGILATGRAPAMMTMASKEEEFEKQLSVVLREGDPIFVLDNVSHPVKGDLLCSTLTQETVQARILGVSERMVLPTGCLIIATGNNLQLHGDVSRRAVICRMDAGVERPDQRQFDFDPREVARERRAELVVAALTALRGYIAAGRPNPPKQMGSFEDYGLIRGALMWLGLPDPELTRSSVFDSDPQRDALAELLAEWHRVFGENAVTMAQVHAEWQQSESRVGALVAMLMDLTGQPRFNGRSVGKRLATVKDRIVGGLVLRKVGNGSAGARWQVLQADRPRQAELTGGWV